MCVFIVKTALALTFGSAKVSEPFPLVLFARRDAPGFNHFVGIKSDAAHTFIAFMGINSTVYCVLMLLHQVPLR